MCYYICLTMHPSVGIQTPRPESKSSHHNSIWDRIIVRFLANRRVNKIKRSLKETEKIHTGRLPTKTFDDFLADF